MRSLLDLYLAHQGRVSDRWSAYIKHYDRLFAAWRTRPLRLLEIGVQNGGSLELWRGFFPQARLLLGCDIDPLCAELRYDDPGIAVIVADACSDAGQRQIAARSPAFDLVIDDGSHRSGQIVDAFARYFPMLTEGGLYVVEDLHCSYWDAFEGGLADPHSAIAFFKRLADVVNHEHWGVELCRADLLAGFAARYGCRFDEAALAGVHAVEFSNSLCVVRKAPADENALGPRLIAGRSETVSAGAAQHRGEISIAPTQSANRWSQPEAVDSGAYERSLARCQALETRLRRFERALAAARRRHAALAAKLADRTALLAGQAERLAAQDAEAGGLRRECAGLHEALQARDAQLAGMIAAQHSASARLARLMERGALSLFPLHTRRRRALSHGVRLAYQVYRHGPLGALRLHLQGRRARRTAAGTPENRGRPLDYAEWIRRHEPDAATLAAQRAASPPYDPDAPLFSVIVPVYRIPGEVLQATMASLRRQSFRNWEACVAYADVDNAENWSLLVALASEEPRIRVLRLPENRGISGNSNAALTMARGEFLALLDHDDELTPWALHDMAQRIAERPESDFLYSDKDSIDAAGVQRQNPLFKPGWSPEMLYSANYLTHLNVMRRTLVEAVGGWRPETDGAQDWDLFLRVTERSPRIERVPGVGYHWRIIAGSTATGLAAKPYAALAQLRAVEDRVRRLALPAQVTPHPESGFRLNWHLGPAPCVDLIVHGDAAPDSAVRLAAMAEGEAGLFASVTWVGAGSAGSDLRLAGRPLPTIRMPSGRPPAEAWTEAMQAAVARGRAPVILFLDLTATHLAPGSLRELAGWALCHPEIGFASGLSLLADETVVEAGRVVGEGLRTQPLFRGTPARHCGPLGGPLWYRNVSAAGPGLIAFKRSAWCLDARLRQPWPQAFAGCCVDVAAAGLRGVLSPYARAYLASMPAPEAGDWHASFAADPYFHPAFASVMPLAMVHP